MKTEIKQLVPINENLTPLLYSKNTEKAKEKGFYFDAYSWNWNGYVALMEDNNEIRYLFVKGEGTDNFDIPQFVNTMHCRFCGQRMIVDNIPWEEEIKTAGSINFKKLTYRCPCGAACHYNADSKKIINRYRWMNLDAQNDIKEPFKV